jgi:hypothetical protein
MDQETGEENMGFLEESSDHEEMDDGSGIDGLTAINSWYPGRSTSFKFSAVCHDIPNDIYGIAAVFHLSNNTDSLYYIKVEGDSTSLDYGKKLSSTLLVNASQIDSVDCTSDDGSNIFIAYDRKNYNASWLRINGSTVYGPYSVYHDIPGRCSDFGKLSHIPRIAYNKNQYIVLVAYEGYDYSIDKEGCEVYTQAYHISGGRIHSDFFWWGEGMLHEGYDVEWNGSDMFILGVIFAEHAPPMMFASALFNYAGWYSHYEMIANWGDPITDPGFAWLKMTYTDGNKNIKDLLVVQTDAGSTYWIRTDGTKYSPGDNPRYDYGGIFDHYAVCEYWGSLNRIAHTFNGMIFFNPGPPPVIGWYTRHMHWDQKPNDPLEIQNLNNNYYPDSCNADASSSLDDPEVLLVSTKAPDADYKVYWNMETQ